MGNGSPQRYGPPRGRFWGNVVLIAVAHVALVAGLIRWSMAARPSVNPESIVWLGGAGDLSSGESEQESPPPMQPATDTESAESEHDEAADEKALVTNAKSEIELPSVTPKPTVAPSPGKPKITPAPRTKTTAKPTAKKAALPKASPKPATKPKPIPTISNAKLDKRNKIVFAKRDSAPQGGSGQGKSTGKDAIASGGSSASEFGWYGKMLHDRFYSAWIQPTTNVPSGTKISTLVNVRIENDGRVSKFEIAKPSANATVNESVAAVAKQVSHVDPPPTGLIRGDHYDVKINFELNTGEH